MGCVAGKLDTETEPSTVTLEPLSEIGIALVVDISPPFMPSAPRTILTRWYFTPEMSSVAITSPPVPEFSVVLSAILC